MKNVKSWLIVAVALAALGSGIAIFETASTKSALAQAVVVNDDRWHFHDGHWSHWNAADKRWYYTNGDHWYYHDNNRWNLYRFDKHFGRKFERGDYAHPGPDVKVVLPHHKIYVAP